MTDAALRPSILRLITRLNIGGPARHALLLSKGLAEYRTTLAAGVPTPDEGELLDPSVSVHRVPLVRPPSPILDTRSLAMVRRLLVSTGAVLLHTHMAKAGTVGRVGALSLPRRPRLVHTFHGHVLEGYFGPRARRAILETERALARRTDALVAVSPEIRDELLDLGIGRPSQFHVIPVGLDLTSYLSVERPSGGLRAGLGLRPGVPLVGVVGRLVPIKDHFTLFAVMAKLPGVHLAVVGDGVLRSALEARASELALADRIHFTGWRSDLADVLGDLDVVVLTSRNEGTPVALIEGGAAGRPVVATDVGGVRSVVVDGVTGLLAGAGDEDGLAAALRCLTSDASLRARMGEAGRRHVREKFGADRLLQDVRSLYGELLGRPRGDAAGKLIHLAARGGRKPPRIPGP